MMSYNLKQLACFVAQPGNACGLVNLSLRLHFLLWLLFGFHIRRAGRTCRPVCLAAVLSLGSARCPRILLFYPLGP
ncbi:hypothetical protein D3C86_2147490 [compost metagenome]